MGGTGGGGCHNQGALALCLPSTLLQGPFYKRPTRALVRARRPGAAPLWWGLGSRLVSGRQQAQQSSSPSPSPRCILLPDSPSGAGSLQSSPPAPADPHSCNCSAPPADPCQSALLGPTGPQVPALGVQTGRWLDEDRGPSLTPAPCGLRSRASTKHPAGPPRPPAARLPTSLHRLPDSPASFRT